MADIILRASQAGYGQALALADLSVKAGEHLAIIGPNGAGKSTLLKLLAGLLLPTKGMIFLEGYQLKTLNRKDIAQKIAWLSQNEDVAPECLVSDYITLGRLPFHGTRWAAEDQAAIRTAIDHCGVTSLLKRSIGSLSGGERQRVMLARCLAQTPRILLLDEPTNHLDLAARSELLSLLRDLPLTILAVLHDLASVPEFASRTLLLHAGKIMMDGPSSQVLLSGHFEDTFGLKAHRVTLEDGHTSFVFRAKVS